MSEGAKVIAIAPGATLETDRQRELLSIVAEALAAFEQATGEAPASICFVIHGEGKESTVGYEVAGWLAPTLSHSSVILAAEAMAHVGGDE